MPALRLQDLPAPPPGKTGWPWTEESPALPERMPDGSEWPRISIVTPNYNYERYLEWTIRSVLLQGYPNLEYIVQDDGSTKDNSVELIRKYEKHLAYWSTEPNAGQPAVINRGLKRSTGSILAYINSDDYYAPGAFAIAAKHFHAHPECDFLHGICRYVNEQGEKVGTQFGGITRLDEVLDLWDFWWGKHFVQPETFWTRRIYEKVGPFRTDLYIVFDYEYWCRMLMAGAVVQSVKEEIACFRYQPTQKTGNAERTAAEEMAVIRPWLWDPKIHISKWTRIRLQGKWLLDAKFRPAADESVKSGESRLRRWARLARISLRHPQLLTSRGFRQRVLHLNPSKPATSSPSAGAA